MRRRAFALVAFAHALAFAGHTQAAQPLTLPDMPVPIPEIAFADGDGTARTLTDYRGRIVLLNIWATWCVPCRTEMPTLDRLQGELGGADFEVVALSIDRGGPDVVRKFFSEIGVRNLAVNVDSSSQAAFVLGAVGLPVTLLINREGLEIGRLVGPAEWDAPEVVAFLKSIIAGAAAPSPTPQQ